MREIKPQRFGMNLKTCDINILDMNLSGSARDNNLKIDKNDPRVKVLLRTGGKFLGIRCICVVQQICNTLTG